MTYPPLGFEKNISTQLINDNIVKYSGVIDNKYLRRINILF